MIFSVSSVFLAYAFGIVGSTMYVRKLCLVGAGFFWMMWSIISSFAILSSVASRGNIRTFCVILTMLAISQLLLSIVRRKSIRKKVNYSEHILSFGTLFLSGRILLMISSEKFSGFDFIVESARLLVGGLLLGMVTATMLLGHWYLVQPGLTREPISKMCKACMWVLALVIGLWLLPKSMLSVLNGEVSDGWGGTLGYMWIGSCITTGALLFAAFKALQEKSYSAVMATTGLLYLAILVTNGVELIPRAIFS